MKALKSPINPEMFKKCPGLWVGILLCSALFWIAPLTIAAVPSETEQEILTRQARQRFEQGMELQQQGELQQAFETYQDALMLFRETGDRQMEAETLVQIGYTHALAGRYQQALASVKQAVGMFQELKNLEDTAGTLTYLGIIHTMGSHYEDALAVFEEALQLTETTGDLLVMGRTLNRIGETYNRLGRFPEALTVYQRALQLARESKDRLSEGSTLASIGNIYAESGQYAEAFQTYHDALPILLQEGDRQGAANMTLNRGSTYARVGEYQKALENFTLARDEFRNIRDQRGEATSLVGIGLVYDEMCQATPNYCLKAIAAYQRALTMQQSMEDRSGQATTLHNLGGVYDRLGQERRNLADSRRALQYYQDSLRLTEAIGERALQARTLNNLGEMHIYLSARADASAELDQALTSLRQALALQQAIGDRAQEWVTRSNLGRVAELQQQPEDALALYTQAIEILDAIITDAKIDDLTISLAAKAAQTYQRAVRLLMQQGQPEQAFQFSERARARALLDQLGNLHLWTPESGDQALIQQQQTLRQELAELERRIRTQQSYPDDMQDAELIAQLQTRRQQQRAAYEEVLLNLKLSNPKYFSLVRVAPLAVKDVQQLLDQDVTLLSYFVAPDVTLAFLITHDAFRSVELPVGEAQLYKAIMQVRRQPADPATPSPGALKDLYTWLVAPLKPYLTTAKIGLIPHRVLHYLPFAALTDGPRYFGAEYTLFFLPSASVLDYVLKQRTSGQERSLALAYSEPQGYAPLCFADQEIAAIARFRKTARFTGPEATETIVKARAGEFSGLHLAAHAELNTTTPLFSRIVLAPDAGNDGMLEVHEVYELDLRQTGLAVLSACNTQLGKLSRGDDFIGLTRAFLYAGMSAVIASLWSVDDQATGDLMAAFYAQLKRGKTLAEALQQAQTATRAKYPHPYYWAAFGLTGDPGTTTAHPLWGRILMIGMVIGIVLFGVLLKMKKT